MQPMESANCKALREFSTIEEAVIRSFRAARFVFEQASCFCTFTFLKYNVKAFHFYNKELTLASRYKPTHSKIAL